MAAQMVRLSRREGLQLTLGAARAVLLAATGCQVRSSTAPHDRSVARSGRPPTTSRVGGYTPFPFVTTSNPRIDHMGVATRPGYSPSDPRSASIIDPMSGIQLFRVGGNNGEPILIDGTQNSGVKFPRILRNENNPRVQKVWNADATLLMIDRRYRRTDDAGDARSYLIDLSGTHGASAPWRVIRASERGGLGDLSGIGAAQHWFWDMLNPLRAYVVGADGMYEWWPVGGNGHSTGEQNLLFDWPSGYAQFNNVKRDRLQTSYDGLIYLAGCRRNDGVWGGFRVRLDTGQFGPFVANPNNYNDDNDRGVNGTSAAGNYGFFSPDGAFCQYYNMVTGEAVSISDNNFSHMDNALVDGIEYGVGYRNGTFNMYNIATGQAVTRGNFPAANPQHPTCRNWKDTFENHGATGDTSGLRYAIQTRSNPNSGHPRGIFGVRLRKNDFNTVRYICNHRSVRTTNSNECHPNVSPDVEYIVFNSNWHEPGVETDGDVHPYVAVIPDAWSSPHNDGS